MLSLVAILVLSVFTQQTFADEPEAIVGGTRAQPGEFPYQCSLRVNNQHVCGCTIVSPTCVVTAAHCLDGVVPKPYNRIVIYVGTISSREGTSYPVQKGVVHPNYGGKVENSWVNDAAVLIPSRPIQMNKYVGTVRLATTTPASGTQCFLSGWGKTSTTSSVSHYLLKANVAVVDNNTCRNAHRSQPITNAHMCTFAQRGIGACQGDSGGPLVCNGVLSGIVSWVLPCAVGVPDVFCNVATVRSFLQSHCPGI